MSVRMRLLSLALCAAWALCPASGFAQSGPSGSGSGSGSARGGPVAARPQSRLGFLHTVLDKEEIKRLKSREKVSHKNRSMKRLYYGENTSHVAAGTALRNRVSGFIQLRGVPANSEIVRSYLFWNFSDTQEVGDETAPILLDRNLIVGTKTADNTDPCWGNAGNHSYFADVTRFTNQTVGPNQDYEVTLPFPAGTSTSGFNPWAPFETQDVRIDGASLIVVYRNAETAGSLVVLAPPGDNMFFGGATYFIPSSATPGPALFTLVGANGQRGTGFDSGLSNETTAFDGVQIAGPAVTGSDWDGSDGLPLPQLWDTQTHLVDVVNNPSQVDYVTPNGDCLVPVAFVLDLQ
jgi:hypothetical protein